MSKVVLRFADDKSDRFWWVESQNNEFVLNWGKMGTSGRYQIKEYDTDEECEKEILKLIAQKKKKGYQDFGQFDFIDHFYFDDEEIGLHPLTSHPAFRAHFVEDFYYDCVDEEAPFGSDEGSDTLSDMQSVVRKKGLFDFSLYPKSLIENEWGMKYIPVLQLNEADVSEILEKDEMNLIQSDM